MWYNNCVCPQALEWFLTIFHGFFSSEGIVNAMFGFGFDWLYLVMIAPALLLALWAQSMVKSRFAWASQIAARMTGAQAARKILDAHGLYDVQVEAVNGQLSDHYDPTTKVVRLSSGVYGTNSMAAVGIAAHEVGHALQDAKRYAPMIVRNMAVPVANFGSGLSSILFMLGIGLLLSGMQLGQYAMLAGIALFSATVFFQLVNLPVEFNASSRAKDELVNLGIVSGPEIGAVSKVLNAAALTYVAATLQAVLTLAYYLFRYSQLAGNHRES
jgi:Zn-dependent membrane protease YugP